MNQSESAGIVHCWEKLLAAWEPASAMEAGQLLAAGTLFKDAREAGLEAPTAGAEADEPEDTAEGAAEWATAEPEEDDDESSRGGSREDCGLVSLYRRRPG